MLMEKGFKINNKHTLIDFGAKLKSRSIGLPTEKQVTDSVPYMNGNYNFSRILGKAFYENRELKYTFLLVRNENIYDMENRKRKFLTWLYSLGINEKLYDYAIPSLYYKVTVKNIEIEEHKGYCEIIVTFDAYPFKIDYKNGNTDVWDTFNFETDVLQGYYEVINTLEITLVNNGLSEVKVDVTADSGFSITEYDGNVQLTTTLNDETKEGLITLKPGENDITVNGTGTIYFTWDEEVI